jgi:hypothetical protein
LGSKYPEFPSATDPYRFSFRHTSTRWLARLLGKVNVKSSHGLPLFSTDTFIS